MQSTVIEVRTGSEETVRDLTAECERFLAGLVAGDGQLNGLLHVWVPHATAGLAVLETGAGSDTDLLLTGPLEQAQHEEPRAIAPGVLDDRVQRLQPLGGLGRVDVGQLARQAVVDQCRPLLSVLSI